MAQMYKLESFSGRNIFFIIIIFFNLFPMTNAMRCHHLHKRRLDLISGHNKTLHCEASRNSTVKITVAGKPLDTEMSTLPNIQKTIFYQAYFTASPELHMKYLNCTETSENGKVEYYASMIYVEFPPQIEGSCTYNKEENQFHVDYATKSYPQLLTENLKFYPNEDETTKDTFNRNISEITQTGLKVHFKVKNQGRNITVTLQASNRIGKTTNKNPCTLPLESSKEPGQLQATPASGEMRGSAGVRLAPHWNYAFLQLFVILFFCST